LHSHQLVRSETGATDNKLKLKPIVAFMHRLLHYAPMTKRKACENQKKAQKQDKQRLTEHKEQEKKQQQIEMSQVKSSVAIKSRKRTSNSGLSEPMEVVSQLDVQMSQCSMQEEFDNFEGKPSKTSHIIRPNIEHLHELPQELLAHILSWLNVQDLLVAERVCLLWKRLMRDFDSLVWRPICMRKWESEEPCALLVESWREAWFRGNKTMPSHLIKMKKLSTSQNNYLAITGGITALPSIFFSMVNQLTSVSLSFNRITYVPVQISEMKNLRSLCLDHNCICSVPVSLSYLTKLEHLCLDHNQITSLPPQLSRLTNLKYMNIFGNRLTTIPSELMTLPLLRLDCSLHHVPIQTFKTHNNNTKTKANLDEHSTKEVLALVSSYLTKINAES